MSLVWVNWVKLWDVICDKDMKIGDIKILGEQPGSAGNRGIQLIRLWSMKSRISTKSNQKSMEKYAHDCIISIKQHQIRFVFFCCTVLFPKTNRATRLKQIGANAWRWKKHGGSRISVWYWKSAMPKRILIISPLISWRCISLWLMSCGPSVFCTCFNILQL